MVDPVNDTQHKPSNSTLYDKVIWYLHRLLFDAKKKFGLLLICLLLPTALLLFMNYRKSNTYKASFTVIYEELVRKVYGDRLDKMNAIIQNQPEKVPGLLGITDNACKSLVKVGGTNILGEELSKDLSLDKIPFIVYFYVNDTSYISEIQAGIINFLEDGNAFLTDKKEIKIKEIEEELIFINSQLSMMDTLKRKFNSTSMQSSDKTDISLSSVYQLSYELYKKKQDLEKKREMPRNIYVIDDALAPMQGNRSYIIMTLAGLILGSFLYLTLVYLLMPAIRMKED
ncbi:MAG: hypothetical protein H6551_02665 [Chitinophagales bacterium]|nr:hypothetical protein [Chitinophagaceae bacterium]MCB9064025.1 hypothetical protein [Chitinophagales bacterium]